MYLEFENKKCISNCHLGAAHFPGSNKVLFIIYIYMYKNIIPMLKIHTDMSVSYCFVCVSSELFIVLGPGPGLGPKSMTII